MNQLEILPHPDVKTEWTHFKLVDLIHQMGEPDFDIAANRAILREASLINLWFFLRMIASYSGPYSKLTETLHVDMCNIRQRMMTPGYRGAVFIPRSMFKSTIFTHGAGAFEILRDPNIRIGIVSAKVELSAMFMIAIQRIFDSNPLVAYLFPEFIPTKNAEGQIAKENKWSKTETIIPARTRDMPEPTVKPIGAGGNTQGNHFDLLLADDLVGEAQLDSGHLVSAEMTKIGNWFDSNSETLLITPSESRCILSATRYAINDAYEFIFDDLAEMIGYWEGMPYTVHKGDPEAENDPPGQWSVYYRQALEYDEPIFPEKVDKAFLSRVRKRNPWLYFTQYLNNPFAASASEFRDYEIKKVQLDYNQMEGYFVTYFNNGKHIKWLLADCEVTLSLDPAASDKRMSNKTSRSAMVVQARSPDDKLFYIDCEVGYFSTTQMIDKLFTLYRRYKNYIESSNVEMGGPFKLLESILYEEQTRQKTYIGLRKINPLPDKVAKLRNFLQPLLEQRRIFAVPKVAAFIEEELLMFPGGSLKDTLDAMELAYRTSVCPEDAESREAKSRIGTNNRANVSKVTGY